MIHVLFAAFMLTVAPDDTIPPVPERIDTLKEVEIVAPGRISGLEDALRQSLERMQGPSVPSLSDVLNKISPGLMDKILPLKTEDEPRGVRRYKRFWTTSTTPKPSTTWCAKHWNAKALPCHQEKRKKNRYKRRAARYVQPFFHFIDS